MITPDATDAVEAPLWTDRVLTSRAAVECSPDGWQSRAYRTYRERLLQSDYPCFFGQTGERRKEVCYAFVSRGEDAALAQALRTFARLSRTARYARYSLSVFFEPDRQVRDHAQFSAWFWGVLRTLRSLDDVAPTHADPDTPLWEFSFHGVEMFVVATSPTYIKRRSRNLGDGAVLLFQPRQLFIDPDTGLPISAAVRRMIHHRMLAYDDMPVHPDIGFYGAPNNREWKQYLLPDDNAPVHGVCPFHSG